MLIFYPKCLCTTCEKHTHTHPHPFLHPYVPPGPIALVPLGIIHFVLVAGKFISFLSPSDSDFQNTVLVGSFS
jgi:hypothetical protein